jgi:hypothetical protein
MGTEIFPYFHPDMGFLLVMDRHPGAPLSESKTTMHPERSCGFIILRSRTKMAMRTMMMSTELASRLSIRMLQIYAAEKRSPDLADLNESGCNRV